MEHVFASVCISVLRSLNHFTSNHWNKVTTAELCFGGPKSFTISFILQNQLPRHVGQLSVLGTSKSCWWLESALPFWSQLLSLPFSYHVQAQLHSYNPSEVI